MERSVLLWSQTIVLTCLALFKGCFICLHHSKLYLNFGQPWKPDYVLENRKGKCKLYFEMEGVLTGYVLEQRKGKRECIFEMEGVKASTFDLGDVISWFYLFNYCCVDCR